MKDGLLHSIAEGLFRTKEQHIALGLAETYVDLLGRIREYHHQLGLADVTDLADVGLQALKIPTRQQIIFFGEMDDELASFMSTVARAQIALAQTSAPADEFRQLFEKNDARRSEAAR